MQHQNKLQRLSLESFLVSLIYSSNAIGLHILVGHCKVIHKGRFWLYLKIFNWPKRISVENTLAYFETLSLLKKRSFNALVFSINVCFCSPSSIISCSVSHWRVFLGLFKNFIQCHWPLQPLMVHCKVIHMGRLWLYS